MGHLQNHIFFLFSLQLDMKLCYLNFLGQFLGMYIVCLLALSWHLKFMFWW